MNTGWSVGAGLWEQDDGAAQPLPGFCSSKAIAELCASPTPRQEKGGVKIPGYDRGWIYPPVTGTRKKGDE